MSEHLPYYDEIYVVSDIHMGGHKDSNVDFQIFNKGKRLAGLIRTLIERRPGCESSIQKAGSGRL